MPQVHLGGHDTDILKALQVKKITIFSENHKVATVF